MQIVGRKDRRNNKPGPDVIPAGGKTGGCESMEKIDLPGSPFVMSVQSILLITVISDSEQLKSNPFLCTCLEGEVAKHNRTSRGGKTTTYFLD